MIFQAKYSEVVKLVVVLWICFMVTHCPCAPPPYVEPIIYVSLARWENRTFSPRIYYVMMGRQQQQQSNLNQVRDDPYPYESPVPMHKSDEKPQDPFFTVRNAFHKRANENLATTEPAKNIISSTTIINETDTYGHANDKGKEHIKFYSLPEEDKITFEVSPQKEDDPIVFKDSIPTTVNRRIKPEGSKQNLTDLHKPGDKCVLSRHLKGREPRCEHCDDNRVQSLDLALKIVQNTNSMNDNFVFSPLSILNILGLLYLGSSDTTFNELSNLLQISASKENQSADTFHENMSEMMSVLTKCMHPKVLLETANEIFADTNYPIRKSFEEKSNRFYGAGTVDIDFSKDGELFKLRVNSWVREKTRGKINSVIDSPPSPLTTLALVNAIYFQGTWDVPFSSYVTREGLFHIDERTTTAVKFMTNILEVPYVGTPVYEMIRLPYKGGDTALYIILPKALGVVGLQTVERTLTTDLLSAQIYSMTSQEPSMVTVKLPKMRVQSDGHVKDTLSNLGVASLFNASSANLSRMSSIPGLHVSALLHSAIVDINEKGTEAAAVSVATGDRIIGTNEITFTVNRPFLFLIYNNLAETVLFWGRIVKPEPLDE